ncbi:HAMP domain-containing sensor histidine kinase [Galbibacter sp. EGI 63066]|uniref:sensor histidine kinase n=1 Tax=Galbibacter sp. EGI 63066 TaxID=2993559 RepID=UPI0022494E5B|nr:HAMP domain-containing sensor histidine kinase [Galbibacter sp. EGI 63066]MCX2681736.1 HAMP domain-containing sensor histidine kinase [Galbibacter sp. EGI 63066]
MIYRKYKIAFALRIVILFIFLVLLTYAITIPNTYAIVGALLLSIISAYQLYRFTIKRFIEIDDFFEAVKYRDFSRWYSEKHGSKDIQKLHVGFNEVNRTIKEINTEKETQYLYLQKILEVVQVGIIAYNTKTGKILWMNESLKESLNIPSIKNISFIQSRKKELFNVLFKTNHAKEESITIDIENEKNKMLVSSSIFNIDADSYKLVVLQNIEDTLNKNESEAWKKLLSVMTHEIMNSIAPITSLAETLKGNIQETIDNPKQSLMVTEDLYEGIESIQKRSEGLMKFAKTYRSLNKITQLNLQQIKAHELFQNINRLMHPSIQAKGVLMEYTIEPQELELEIDSYLIEQVLINLILNAVDACENISDSKIEVFAFQQVNGSTIIKVSDNGKGIPEEIIDNVFVPFFSTKKSGSGIGLSLCKQIMLLHKGKIQIQSKEGRGTIISLAFL